MLHDYLDNAIDIIQSTTPDGSFLYVNRKWREILGYSEADVNTLSIRNIVHPEHRIHFQAAWQRLLAGETLDDFESVFLAKNGQTVTVKGNIRPQFETGQIHAVRAILRDITESRHTLGVLQKAKDEADRSAVELELRSRELTRLSEMEDLLQSCRTLDETYDVASRHLPLLFPDLSGALCALSDVGNLVEAIATWGDIKAEECVFRSEDCWALRRGRPHPVEEREAMLVCHHLSKATPAKYLCVPLVAQHEMLGLLHLQSKKLPPLQGEESGTRVSDAVGRLALIVADHIALALASLRLREALQHRPVRDPLTGLFTRIFMQESLERELRRAARYSRPLGIVILDIDNFQGINETYGRDAGDMMLREFAKDLAGHVRREDVTCRYGGEEFVLILPEASLDIVRQRAEQLHSDSKRLAVITREQNIEGLALSIGIASFPEHGNTAETLLQAADHALYHAKALGRDRVVVAQSGRDTPQA